MNKNLKDILPEKKKETQGLENYRYVDFLTGAQGYNQAIDDCHAKLGELVDLVAQALLGHEIKDYIIDIMDNGGLELSNAEKNFKADLIQRRIREALDQLQADNNNNE